MSSYDSLPVYAILTAYCVFLTCRQCTCVFLRGISTKNEAEDIRQVHVSLLRPARHFDGHEAFGSERSRRDTALFLPLKSKSSTVKPGDVTPGKNDGDAADSSASPSPDQQTSDQSSKHRKPYDWSSWRSNYGFNWKVICATMGPIFVIGCVVASVKECYDFRNRYLRKRQSYSTKVQKAIKTEPMLMRPLFPQRFPGQVSSDLETVYLRPTKMNVYVSNPRIPEEDEGEEEEEEEEEDEEEVEEGYIDVV